MFGLYMHWPASTLFMYIVYLFSRFQMISNFLHLCQNILFYNFTNGACCKVQFSSNSVIYFISFKHIPYIYMMVSYKYFLLAGFVFQCCCFFIIIFQISNDFQFLNLCQNTLFYNFTKGACCIQFSFHYYLLLIIIYFL